MPSRPKLYTFSCLFILLMLFPTRVQIWIDRHLCFPCVLFFYHEVYSRYLHFVHLTSLFSFFKEYFNSRIKQIWLLDF